MSVLVPGTTDVIRPVVHSDVPVPPTDFTVVDLEIVARRTDLRVSRNLEHVERVTSKGRANTVVRSSTPGDRPQKVGSSFSVLIKLFIYDIEVTNYC